MFKGFAPCAVFARSAWLALLLHPIREEAWISDYYLDEVNSSIAALHGYYRYYHYVLLEMRMTTCRPKTDRAC